MKIYFSVDNNSKIVPLPYVPAGGIEFNLGDSQNVQVGQYIMMGKPAPSEITISIDLPKHKASFHEPGTLKYPTNYIGFFLDCRKKKKPVRIVAVHNNGATFFNYLTVIESFSKSVPRQNGDIPITISFKRYRK